MKFYDMHVRSNFSIGTSSIMELARFAKELGFAGIAVCDKFESVEKLRIAKDEMKRAEREIGIEIYPGVTIEASNPMELKQMIAKAREHALVVAVSGGAYAINRAACEDSRVDILIHPEAGRNDCGLDEVCMKAAAANGVAMGVDFRTILYSFRKGRGGLLANIATMLRLAEHFKVRVVVCSGSQSIWDMRDPRELISIVNVLGLDFGKSFQCLSDIPASITEANRKKLMGATITEGVDVVG
ncbi:MAG: RNase P subunit p30 family protein [Candidatus Aenigmatarchaeota archaeon]